jgi:hypothetical protein
MSAYVYLRENGKLTRHVVFLHAKRQAGTPCHSKRRLLASVEAAAVTSSPKVIVCSSPRGEAASMKAGAAAHQLVVGCYRSNPVVLLLFFLTVLCVASARVVAAGAGGGEEAAAAATGVGVRRVVVDVGVILDRATWLGNISWASMELALEDFYADERHADSSTRVRLHLRDTGPDAVDAASAGTYVRTHARARRPPALLVHSRPGYSIEGRRAPPHVPLGSILGSMKQPGPPPRTIPARETVDGDPRRRVPGRGTATGGPCRRPPRLPPPVAAPPSTAA